MLLCWSSFSMAMADARHGGGREESFPTASRAVIQHGRVGREGVLEESRSPHSSQEDERRGDGARGKERGQGRILSLPAFSISLFLLSKHPPSHTETETQLFLVHSGDFLTDTLRDMFLRKAKLMNLTTRMGEKVLW